MFVRVKTTPNSPRKSVQIVESVRDGEKVKQKIVRHVGIAMNEAELEKLIALGEFVKAQMEDAHQLSFFSPEERVETALAYRRKIKEDQEAIKIDLKEFREESRSVAGIHEAYGEIYREMGFDRSLPNPKRQESMSRILYHLVMARIANPCSKRASVAMLESDFGISIGLDAAYRLMDKLDDDVIERIQNIAFQNTQSLLKDKIDVLFYDCTTLYFESFKPDDFKQNGYSKDLKFNQPQVLLALFVTEQGLPVGYDVFPGATFEGHTLKPILEKLKAKFNLRKVVFVADSAMLSKININDLKESEFQYIIGARLRNLTKENTAKILDRQCYSRHDDGIDIADLPLGSERLIVSYSKTRAEKDKHDRTKAISSACRIIQKSKNPKLLLNNHGAKRFLKVVGDTAISLNDEKIEKESLFDGLHGVVTNIKDTSPDKILDYYKGLWQIEESFRIQKHDLKIRPIFHWSPSRIKAHIAISFIAFCCIRTMTYKVALQFQKLSPEVIRNELVHLQFSIIKHRFSNDRYVIPSNFSLTAKKIYHALGLRISNIPFKLSPIT